MEKENEIARLENYIERLLEGYSSLKAEKAQLEKKLKDRKTENDRLNRQLEAMDTDRGEITSRVSSLIDRIERWQSEADTSQQKDGSEAGEAVEQSPDGHGDDDEPEAEYLAREEEKHGGVQGSLFNSRS